MLPFWQQNYAQIHDPQDGNPLQVYDIVQQPIKYVNTRLPSIDSQLLSPSPLREDVQLYVVIRAKSFLKEAAFWHRHALCPHSVL